MVIQRSPLCPLYELKRIAKQHLVVSPPEAVVRLLGAMGIDLESLSIAEQHGQVRRLIQERREQDFLGCVRVGEELWDAYRISPCDAVLICCHNFGLKQILILARHMGLG